MEPDTRASDSEVREGMRNLSKALREAGVIEEKVEEKDEKQS